MPKLRTCLIATVVLSLCGAASAENSVSLMLAPNGSSADLVFKEDMLAADAFVIRLSGIAVPGSRLKISIDRAKRTLFERIIDPDQCTFADGPVTCLIPIEGGTPEFTTLVQAFKAGLVAHIEITNAGYEPMTSDTSLKGFTKSFDAL